MAKGHEEHQGNPQTEEGKAEDHRGRPQHEGHHQDLSRHGRLSEPALPSRAVG